MSNEEIPSASLRGSPICTATTNKPLRKGLSRRSQALAACPVCGSLVATLSPRYPGEDVDSYATHGWDGEAFCAGSLAYVEPPKSANAKLSCREEGNHDRH